jgi:GAF domain-containing protein/HAMP domain-containing protein
MKPPKAPTINEEIGMLENQSSMKPLKKKSTSQSRIEYLSGLSLRTKLIISNLTITIIVILSLGSFIYFSSNRTNTYLTDQYQTSILQQIESNLTEVVQREAQTQDGFFANVKNNLSLIGKTTEILFSQENKLGSGSYWNAKDSLTMLPQGSWDNANSEVGSIFIPSFSSLNTGLIREINTLKQLDYSIPTVLQNNPDVVAIYFGGSAGETLYYPNVDLANIVPADFNVTTRPWFTSASSQDNLGRNPVWSTPYLDAALNGLVITNSLPIYDFQDVIAIDVKLNNISTMASKIKIGQTGYAFIIDKKGRIIAMPPEGYSDFGFSPEEIASGESINQTILEKVTLSIFPALAEMAAGRNDINIITLNNSDHYLAYHYIPSVQYSLGVVVPVNEMQAPFIQTSETLVIQNRQTIINVAILIITVLTLSLLATIFIGNTLTIPLVQLTQTARKISEGDLEAKANITSRDEVGILSETINTMTHTLQGMITFLEDRVEERTKDLQKRASQLETIAEVAREIASIKDSDMLCPSITSLISKKFGYYHCGIFLTDENNKYQELRAASSDGGKLMLSRGHKLHMDDNSIVGYTALLGEPRIALDVGTDKVFFNNPDLPETRSEMALPLKIRNDVIGVLDVQSNETGAFLQDDAKTLGTLADQIAIAIQNTRLFDDSRRSLEESKKTFKRYISHEWQEYPEQLKNEGYIFDGNQTIPWEKTNPDSKKAPDSIDNIVHAEKHHISPDATLAIPMQIRDQIIGMIEIHANDEHRKWTQEEISLMAAAAERAAIALETARLLDVTQKKAAKEQVITNITSKIGASVDIQNILRTAVEELGHIITESDVEIYLQAENK